MKKLEIISNQSIEEDIIGVFERCGYGENFTCTAPVLGRGRHGRREGSAIWPEENAIFTVYVEDEELEGLLTDLKKLKEGFPEEGFRCYVSGDFQRRI